MHAPHGDYFPPEDHEAWSDANQPSTDDTPTPPYGSPSLTYPGTVESGNTADSTAQRESLSGLTTLDVDSTSRSVHDAFQPARAREENISRSDDGFGTLTEF